MNHFYNKCRTRMWLVCLLAGSAGLGACSDSETEGGGNPGYRPDQPIRLESFYPKSGPIATQVIITGRNFGTDPKALNVYFNEKRAAVISSTGDRMLVLAPKLPGEECVISVSVGEDETNKAQFDELFDYIIQTNVSTVAGGMKGTTMPEGTTSLTGTYFSEKPESGIAIDKRDNLYVRFNINESGTHRVYMMNEQAGNSKVLHDYNIIVTSILLGTDLATGNVCWYHANISNKEYGYFDPLADYANTNLGDIKWDHDLFFTNGAFAPVWNAIKTFVMSPADHKFYFYTNEGVIARWDPATRQGENLTPNERFIDSQGEIAGVVFDPRDPHIVYFSNKGQHCIYKHDIAAGTVEFFAGQKNKSGHLDGPLTEALFNNPCQMCVDADDEVIYVADSENHCIRKIALSTGYVSTFAGTPKSSGYQNGPAEAAKFNKPYGLVMNSEGDLYIGDSENYAIRRIAIE